ncbi:MAG: FecR domain-containing protein [Stenotrophobium sp.]
MNEKMTEQMDAVHEQRRRFLVRALTSGLLVGGAGWNLPALASLFGKLPAKMPAGKSVFDLKGDVRVNGRPMTHDTQIGAQSNIETGEGSYAVIAIGDGAFIVRERSALEIGGKELLVRSLRVVTGALLSVFGHRDTEDRIAVNTPVATIGIRGTGFYTEVEAQRTYFCTCYGHTQVATTDSKESEAIVSTHHNAPRYVLAQQQDGRRIVPAPFKNHTDLELMTIEALCGRTVPFTIPQDSYSAPHRNY